MAISEVELSVMRPELSILELKLKALRLARGELLKGKDSIATTLKLWRNQRQIRRLEVRMTQLCRRIAELEASKKSGTAA